MSGNVPALGLYDIKRAVPLVSSVAEYPYWHLKEGKAHDKYDLNRHLFTTEYIF